MKYLEKDNNREEYRETITNVSTRSYFALFISNSCSLSTPSTSSLLESLLFFIPSFLSSFLPFFLPSFLPSFARHCLALCFHGISLSSERLLSANGIPSIDKSTFVSYPLPPSFPPSLSPLSPLIIPNS